MEAPTAPEAAQMEAPDLRLRFYISLVIGLIAVAAAAIFLALPLEGLNLNPVVLALQARSRDLAAQLWPYIAVAALGAGVGVAEITSTFDDYPREALVARWGLTLILLNAVSAALAFGVARIYTPETNLLLLVIGVGVGFPALIRTKFTLAKQFGEQSNSDLNVNVGWLYDQFQALCKKQIDLALVAYKRRQVNRLVALYTTVPELKQAALYTIQLRTTLTLEEKAARVDEVQQATDPSVAQELQLQRLGLLILDMGGVATVDLLVGARAPVPVPGQPSPKTAPAESGTVMAEAAPPTPPEDSDEALVNNLVQLPLNELEALALEVLKTPDDKDWVKAAAQPSPGMPVVRQKAPIAYFVVEQAGAKAVRQALAQKG